MTYPNVRTCPFDHTPCPLISCLDSRCELGADDRSPVAGRAPFEFDRLLAEALLALGAKRL